MSAPAGPTDDGTGDRSLDRAAAKPPEAVDLAAKLARIHEPWNPKLVAAVNDCDVKLAKLEGEFIWHAHPNEDELFLVISGRLEMRFRERTVELLPGQMIVVPRGTEHLPVAPEGASVLLFEPRTTVNTGDAGGDRTVRDLGWI